MITNVAALSKRPLKVLFIHQNFPGQFKRIAQVLANDPNYDVLAIGKEGCPALKDVRLLTYKLHRSPSPMTHHYARSYESGILHGQAVLRVLLRLKEQGFVPDVLVAHPGWGETLFAKEVFPDTKLIHLCEFYYHAQGKDVGFDPEFPTSLDDAARIRSKNGLMLLNLENCDVAVAPTIWQKSVHPVAYQDKIHVVHEGIDTTFMCPDPTATFMLPSGKVLRVGDPVVTYVSRNLEPYRGFHIFMRSLPAILAAHPDCDIVLAGGDSVSYGQKPKGASSWREKLLAEMPTLDPSRIHFLGKIPFEHYRRLLQVSAAHVYLSYPFVLSWSMLEAMACGCIVIGSRTAPVLEVIKDNENGKLVDFFDVAGIAHAVADVLKQRAGLDAIRRCARQTMIDRYAFEKGVDGYRRMIEANRGAAGKL